MICNDQISSFEKLPSRYLHLLTYLASYITFFFVENDVKSITFFSLMAFFASVFFSIETKSETNQKQGQNRIEISKSFISWNLNLTVFVFIDFLWSLILRNNSMWLISL